MLITSSEEFNSELLRFSPNPTTELKAIELKVIDIQRGRPTGRTEVPMELRKIIGEEALVSSAKDVARAFDISPSSISAYKHGSTSTTSYNNPETELKDHIDNKRSEIADSAREKLKLALEEITSEKVSGAKIKDIASIAKDMSSVVRNMEPSPQIGLQQNNQVVIYRPKMHDEDLYDVITVNE